MMKFIPNACRTVSTALLLILEFQTTLAASGLWRAAKIKRKKNFTLGNNSTVWQYFGLQKRWINIQNTKICKKWRYAIKYSLKHNLHWMLNDNALVTWKTYLWTVKQHRLIFFIHLYLNVWNVSSTKLSNQVQILCSVLFFFIWNVTDCFKWLIKCQIDITSCHHWNWWLITLNGTQVWSLCDTFTAFSFWCLSLDVCMHLCSNWWSTLQL